MELDINDLKESMDFLNGLYDNVTSAIFIADHEPRIYSFNDAFKTLFYKPEDQILQQLCGNAMGCIFTVREQKECGSTSNCKDCILRESILKTFVEKVPVYKEKLVREFCINNTVIKKHFIFTTRYIQYRGDDMILVIVDDVTELEEQKLLIETQNKNLKVLINNLTAEMVQAAYELDTEKMEKEILLKELHHRVGNSLQLISSLINLQRSNMVNEEAQEKFLDTESRIQAIKLVYNQLLKEKKLQKIHMKSYIESLMNSITVNIDRRTVFITVHFDIDDIYLPLNTAMPLGLIVNEAIIGILENTDSQSRKILFEISLRKIAKGMNLAISVKDARLLPSFHELHENLSMELIRALAGQIGGTYDYDTSNGLKVQVNF